MVREDAETIQRSVPDQDSRQRVFQWGRLAQLGQGVAEVFASPNETWRCSMRMQVLNYGMQMVSDWGFGCGCARFSLPTDYPLTHGELDEAALQAYLDELDIPAPQACR